MSVAHKAALAEGRKQGHAVRRYLEALELNRPKRGRKRTKETVRRQLDAVQQKIENADALSRLHLVQQRRDLEAELERGDRQVDMAEREAEFIKSAKSYGARKGISYASWREAGVPASVLQKAGIGRGTRG